MKKRNRPSSFGKIISEIRHEKIKGVNVTLPYKKSITRFIDEMSQTAKDSEAVNTVFLKKTKFMETIQMVKVSLSL